MVVQLYSCMVERLFSRAVTRSVEQSYNFTAVQLYSFTIVQRASQLKIHKVQSYSRTVPPSHPRLTLDTKTGPGQVKGFVVNPLKEDVTAFDLSEKDEEVTVNLEF